MGRRGVQIHNPCPISRSGKERAHKDAPIRERPCVGAAPRSVRAKWAPSFRGEFRVPRSLTAPPQVSLLLLASLVLFFFFNLNLLLWVNVFVFLLRTFPLLGTTSFSPLVFFSPFSLLFPCLLPSLVLKTRTRAHTPPPLALPPPWVLLDTVDFDKKTNEAISGADVEE